MKHYHFISGLPRSGSTLLCALLSQNPDMYATPTSGLCDVLADVNRNWEKYEANSLSPNIEIKKNVLRSMIKGYFANRSESICVDKNRGWLRYIQTISALLGDTAKIIVTVRDMKSVVASWEKLYRKNEAYAELPIASIEQDTIEKRVHFYLRNNGPTQFAYSWLCSCYEKGLQNRLLVIDFDDLVDSPNHELNRVYDFLSWRKFNHDLNSIPQYTNEHDPEPWMAGLHTLRKTISKPEKDWKEILPEDIAEQIDKKYPAIWRVS